MTAGVRSALEVQALAQRQADEGDSSLAEFCACCGEDELTALVRGAIAVIEAPRALAFKTSCRMDLLKRAASEAACVCKGIWIPGARNVLEWQGEDVGRFCQDVCRALDLGACRGVNISIVGAPGSGKSMIFEPLDKIMKVMGKPEAKSSFPFANVVGSQLLLWSEYKHKDSIVLFEDLLALLAGERLEIRIPHRGNESFRNTVPMIFTSNSPLVVVREDPVAMEYLNAAMSERFCARTWTNPIPHASRDASFPKCPCCCATFLLLNRECPLAVLSFAALAARLPAPNSLGGRSPRDSFPIEWLSLQKFIKASWQ